MKYLIAIFVLFASVATQIVTAQSGQSQPVLGAQLMVVQPGLTGYYEQPLGRQLVVRSEVSLIAGYAEQSFSDVQRTSGFGLNTVITVSPRLYYNLHKRQEAERVTARNTGNFVSLRTGYAPGWAVVTNQNFVAPTTGLTIIPTWGLKRALGALRWEVSVGAGYRYTGLKGRNKTAGGALDLRVGIGF